ncbi:MAG: tRNA (guanosine(37)-N1)-methyltransferase TrmD [Nitrospinota bacterium]
MTLEFHILTVFPGMLASPLSEGILKKAIEKGLIEVRLWDLRDFTEDRHRTTDDYPYGGGAGMVMKVEPIAAALEAVRRESPGVHVILTSPQGARLTQSKVRELARRESLALICGRYEGVDERVAEALVDEELSIGDYVLMGGELPALVVVDAVARLVPGVLGSEASAEEDCFSRGLLGYPQYTRPAEYKGLRVPEVLLSGDHKAIERWRRLEGLRRTRARRPDLLEGAELDPEERELLKSLD